jgi:hypothetical protein
MTRKKSHRPNQLEEYIGDAILRLATRLTFYNKKISLEQLSSLENYFGSNQILCKAFKNHPLFSKCEYLKISDKVEVVIFRIYKRKGIELVLCFLGKYLFTKPLLENFYIKFNCQLMKDMYNVKSMETSKKILSLKKRYLKTVKALV